MESVEANIFFVLIFRLLGFFEIFFIFILIQLLVSAIRYIWYLAMHHGNMMMART